MGILGEHGGEVFDGPFGSLLILGFGGWSRYVSRPAGKMRSFPAASMTVGE
ncbi:hypothetical protein [Actinopolymorpha pittospori]|uniref:Uncharacterized protein n=1 Tax=Actinopolymorpha pittospori TaxID=648752 RepID=A0A927RKQ1_9ACTN|nr:hypothetical protein [Actinopolymorpha pittospori]MBE1606963.1 hypothetical protein [Actinopolymorpha pittospori]